MKKALFSLFICSVFLSCNDNTTVYKSNSAIERVMDDAYDENIIEDIEIKLSILKDGISSFNAEKIFSVFANEAGTRYIRQGHIYNFLQKAEWDYARMFKNATTGSHRGMVFVNKEYYVIDAYNVFLTTKGIIGNDDDDEKWEITYTMLWRRISNEWTVYNMHISW